MATITFFNVPGHGHVNPTLPVVKGLVARGHQVIYYNTPAFREKIERTGATFRPYPAPNITSGELAALVGHLVDVTVWLLGESQRLLPFALDELEREQPDVVVFDSICLWGMQAAALRELPTVASISTFVQEGTERMLHWRDLLYLARHALPRLPRLFARRRQLVKRYGPAVFPYRHLFPCIGAENIVYTSRAFQPDTAFLDDSFHFVGPSLDGATRETVDFPWARLDGKRRLVYVSLGTIHRDASFIKQVFAAFADHDAQFVIATGAVDRAAVGAPPANMIARSFVPQLELLRRVDLFVSHGGMNSVNEALYEGVPLVVVPQQMEQVLNGRQVARHGAGVIIGDTPPYGRVTVAQLREAVDRVLGGAPYREHAKRLGRSFRAAGGYAEAVAIVEGQARGA